MDQLMSVANKANSYKSIATQMGQSMPKGKCVGDNCCQQSTCMSSCWP